MDLQRQNLILFILLIVFVTTTCVFLGLYLDKHTKCKTKPILYTRYYTGSARNNKPLPTLSSLKGIPRNLKQDRNNLVSGSVGVVEVGKSTRERPNRTSSPTRNPHPILPGRNVAYLKSLNPNHFLNEDDVMTMINELNQLVGGGISIANEDEIMQHNVRPLESVFWYELDDGSIGTATKYNSITWRPQNYKTANDIAIVYPDSFDWKEFDSFITNNLLMQFIPAASDNF
jgi:hypothetical protein